MPKQPRSPEHDSLAVTGNHKRDRVLAIQRLAAPLHRFLLHYFPRLSPGHYGGKTDTSLDEHIVSCFLTTKSEVSSENHFAQPFRDELTKQGITRVYERPYRIYFGGAYFFSKVTPPPLHVGALAHAHGQLMQMTREPAQSQNKVAKSYLTRPELNDLHAYTDVADLHVMMTENLSTVSQIIGYLTFTAQSKEEVINIIQKNLEPRTEPRAQGFSTFELLANTINGFWGNAPSLQFIPTEILESNGMVSLGFISAVHSMIRHYPERYHGGCPNRYIVDGQTESAVNELVRIFLERYIQSLLYLEPHARKLGITT